MKRGRIKINEGRCYHVTHRCQERRFLLHFDIDRRNYVDRLREVKGRCAVDVLDYMITSNHVHLLFYADRGESVSEAMHFIQGASARDFNRRKEREGAFWCGRFRPTLIQEGVHLGRCLIYIAMNMVRAGRVEHPREWKHCGYQELAGIRERNLLVNRQKLLSCLGHDGDLEGFFKWYRRAVEEKLKASENAREALWTEASAVGDMEWVKALAKRHGVGRKSILELSPGGINVREERASYGLVISEKTRSDFAFRETKNAYSQ